MLNKILEQIKKRSKIRLGQKSLTSALDIPEVFFLAGRLGPDYVSTQFLDLSNFSQDLQIK